MAAKTVEERLTVVEQKVAENARGFEGLRDAIVELGARMDRGFEAVDRRFEAMELRFDQRFEAMELRSDQRFEAMEQRLDRRFEIVDQKMSRQFYWLAGIQITTVLAMIGAVAAIAAAALGR